MTTLLSFPGKSLHVFALLIAFFLCAFTLQAQNTYTGPSGGAWHNNANWSLGAIPVAGDNVVIPAGTTVVVGAGQAAIQITNLTLTTGSGLTLSDANFLATGTASLAGTLTDNTAGGTNQFNGAASTTANFEISGNEAFRFCNSFTIGAGFTFTNNCTNPIPVPAAFNPAGTLLTGPASGITTATPTPYGGFGGLTIQGTLNGSSAGSSFVNGTGAQLTLNTAGFPMSTGGFDVSSNVNNKVRYYGTAGVVVKDANYEFVQFDVSNNTYTFQLTDNRVIAKEMRLNGGRLIVTSAAARSLTIASGCSLICNNGSSTAAIFQAQANVSAIINGTVVRWAENNGAFGGTGGGTMTFANGSQYIHETNGRNIPNSGITWQTGSTCRINGAVTAGTTTAQPGQTGQAFSHFIWNVTNQGAALNPVLNQPVATTDLNISTINGRLRIESTGSGTLILNVDGDPVVQSVGAFEQTGGTFFLRGGTANNNVTNVLNVLGDFNQSGGTITNLTTGSGTGRIAMSGTALAQSFIANGTISELDRLEINNTSGTPNVNLNSNFATTGARLTNLVLTAGNLVFSGIARTVTIRGNISGTGGINMSSAAHTLNAEGAVAFGALTAGTSSTFNYNQSSAGQVVAAANYANLGFSNFNKTLPAGTVGIAGTLNPGSATGHTVTGNTINFNGAGPQNIPAFPNPSGYNHVSTSGGGTKTLVANASIAGNLTLNSGVLNLAGFHLTVAGSLIPGTPYTATNMIRTSGSGRLQKTGTSAASFVTVYPLGTGSLYTPMEITSLTATVSSGQLNIRAVGNQNPNVTGPNALDKYWEISTTGIASPTADLQFAYANPAEVNGTQANYVGRYWDGLAWITPAGVSAAGVNPFSATASSNLDGEWTAGEPGSFLVVTTYTSTGGGGDWDTPGTWSPSGPPTSVDNVIISNGNPVTVSANNRSCNNMTIQGGAILTLGTTSGHTFSTVTGTGTLRLSSGNYPAGNFSAFHSAAGGTTQFQGGSYTLPGQTTFDNLIISGSGTKTSGANLILNGNLDVQAGTGLDLSASNHTLNLAGDFSAAGAYASGTGLHTFSGTSRVIASGAALSIDNLAINGSYTQNATSLTLANALTGSGDLTMASGTSLFLGGTVSLNSLNAGASGTTVSYTQSTPGQAVLAGTYHNLLFSNFNKILPASTITINNAYTPGTATGHTVTGNTFVFNGPAGQTIPGTQYHNLSNGNGNSRVFDPVGTIFIAGTFTPGSNPYTVTGSTVEYNSNGVSQNVADLTGTPAYHNLRFSGSAATRTLSMGANSRSISGTLTVGGNAIFTISADNAGQNFTVTSTAPDAITVNSGGITLTNAARLVCNGRFTNNGGALTGAAVPFSYFSFPVATSEFVHAFNGGNLPSQVQFAAVATCRITGVTTTAPGNVNQTGWGNFEWNCPGQTAPAGFGSGTRTFQNFTVANTGSSYFHFTGGGANTSTINGNLTIAAGAEAHSYSQVTGTSATPVVNGNLLVNGTFELHNNNFGGASFQTWQVLGDVTIGSTGIVRRTSSTSAKIQMAGTVDRVLTINTGGSFTSGLLEINKTSGAKVTLGSNITLPGLAFVSGNLEVTGGRIVTYTGTSSPTRTSGHVALGVGGTNLFRWNAPGSTAVPFFDFPVGPIGAITGYRRIRLANFTTPAGSPSVTIGFANNPGTSPTNATSIRSTPVTVISGLVFPEITFAGGTFGTGDISLYADVTSDFYNGPIAPGDMDIFKAPPGAQAWQFIGAGPIPALVSGNLYSIAQASVLFANGLNRLAIGKSNLLDLGTPQVLTWTGLVSSDWSDQANWNPSQVPSAFNQKVTIPNTPNKPVYTGGSGLNIRGLFVNLGASLRYQGDLGVDSAFTNSGHCTITGLFTTSGANFSGPPAASVFNFGGTGGTNDFGGWLVTNTSTTGVVVTSSTQTFIVRDSLKLNNNAKLNLNGAGFTLKSVSGRTAKIGTIPTSATLSGATAVTWERFIPSNTAGWYFLGTPIQGQTFSHWGDNFDVLLPQTLSQVYQVPPEQSSILTLDGTAAPAGTYSNEVNGWRIPLTSTVSVGTGYRTWLKAYGFLQNSKTYNNTGTVTQGDFTFTTPYNAGGYGGGGWNFLANPYPAALNWDAPTWTKTNVNDAIYIWNGADGQYMSYVNGVSTNGGTNIIPAGQGFIVRNNAAANLIVRETAKFSGSGTFARVASQNGILRIKVKNGQGQTDEAVLRLHEAATSEFDSDLDAWKLPGLSLNLSLSAADGQYSIHSLPGVDENTVIPMHLQAQPGTHQLQIEGLASFPTGTEVWVKDLFLGTLTPVYEGSILSFTVTQDPQSQGSGRFELVFSEQTATGLKTRISGPDFEVFPNPSQKGTTRVRFRETHSGKISVLNMAGKVLFEQPFDLKAELLLQTEVPAGLYLIQIQTKTNTYQQKWIVR